MAQVCLRAVTDTLMIDDFCSLPEALQIHLIMRLTYNSMETAGGEEWGC